MYIPICVLRCTASDTRMHILITLHLFRLVAFLLGLLFYHIEIQLFNLRKDAPDVWFSILERAIKIYAILKKYSSRESNPGPSVC